VKVKKGLNTDFKESGSKKTPPAQISDLWKEVLTYFNSNK